MITEYTSLINLINMLQVMLIYLSIYKYKQLYTFGSYTFTDELGTKDIL